MHLNDFDFDLPEELIAQQPLAERAHSRLLVLQRAAGVAETGKFSDIVDHFQAGDLLVVRHPGDSGTTARPQRVGGQNRGAAGAAPGRL